jgi:hypothetical protein
MSKMKLRLMFAGVFVGCALIAWRIASATNPSGLSTVIVAGPTLLDGIKINSQSDINDVKVITMGPSDVYVVHNTIVPGGHTGWHSHPGPSIISVKSGTATEYNSDDPSTPRVHVAGTCFVDDGDHAHIVRNEGVTNLELVAFQILPRGAMRRIDQPAP